MFTSLKYFLFSNYIRLQSEDNTGPYLKINNKASKNVSLKHQKNFPKTKQNLFQSHIVKKKAKYTMYKSEKKCIMTQILFPKTINFYLPQLFKR